MDNVGHKRDARRAANEASYTSLDNLLGWETHQVDEQIVSKPRAVLGILTGALVIGLMSGVAVLPLVGAGSITVNEAAAYWDELPSELPDQPVPTRSVILAADGTRIAQLYSENRVAVTFDEIPQVMIDAIVSIEDSRFYEHNGIDFRGISRALASNLLTDSTQGGSTLTQQYVKNVLASAAEDDKARAAVTSRTSYMRKLREAKLAVSVEQSMTKEEILLGYLNIAYFGDGAYGIGTAARHYFNTEVADLTLAQAALLAGLVRNPTGYDPTENKAIARQRRSVVLARMRDLEHISEKQYRKANNSPIRLDVTEAPNGCTSSKYPFYCQWVKKQLESDPIFGRTQAQRNERLFRGGMVITTALDPKKQAVAQTAVDRALGRNNRVASVAVTVEPGTGHVVAMAQNRTWGNPKPGQFDKTEIVLGTQPAMQPGSNFKPITLAAALERGLDPATRIYAPYRYAPTNQASPSGGFSNYSQSSGGNLDAYAAIARSSNTWFIRIQEQVGVLNVVSMAERLGITSIPRSGARAITARDASLTLGAYEVSPVQMAGAYATFAAHGVHCTPVAITTIVGPRGNDVTVPPADCHEAIPAPVADTVAQTMVGTISGPDALRTGKAMAFGRPAAGKTGTTQNTAAVWFGGFTPQYATSVWVGDPRGGFAYPLRGFTAYGSYVAKATGGSVAGPIWREVMAGIHQGLPVKKFAKPAVSVATGTVTPDVRGMSLDQAYRSLTRAGFVVELSRTTAERDRVLPPNVVHSTAPAAGSLLGLRSVVKITMSAGSERNVRLPKN